MSRQVQPLLREVAGQPLLEALLQAGPGRARGRHPRHQPGHQPRAAGRPGRALHRQRLRPQGAGPRDRAVPHLPVERDAQRPQRRGPAELLALLPEAAPGRGAAGRGGRAHRRQHGLRRPAARHAGDLTAGQQLQPHLAVPQGLRPAGGGERLRVRAGPVRQPGAEPAPHERGRPEGQARHARTAARTCWRSPTSPRPRSSARSTWPPTRASRAPRS